jgi:hypothetical protein
MGVRDSLDELKTHQRGPGLVLPSRHPDGVRQEVYAFLLMNYAIRELMWQAARQADEDPRPDLLHRHPERGPPPGHRPRRRFPPQGSPAPSPRACVRSCAACYPNGARELIPQ